MCSERLILAAWHKWEPPPPPRRISNFLSAFFRWAKVGKGKERKKGHSDTNEMTMMMTIENERKIVVHVLILFICSFLRFFLRFDYCYYDFLEIREEWIARPWRGRIFKVAPLHPARGKTLCSVTTCQMFSFLFFGYWNERLKISEWFSFVKRSAV